MASGSAPTAVSNERAALDVDDFTRTMKALAGATGKRLTYKPGANESQGAT